MSKIKNNELINTYKSLKLCFDAVEKAIINLESFAKNLGYELRNDIISPHLLDFEVPNEKVIDNKNTFLKKGYPPLEDILNNKSYFSQSLRDGSCYCLFWHRIGNHNILRGGRNDWTETILKTVLSFCEFNNIEIKKYEGGYFYYGETGAGGTCKVIDFKKKSLDAWRMRQSEDVSQNTVEKYSSYDEAKNIDDNNLGGKYVEYLETIFRDKKNFISVFCHDSGYRLLLLSRELLKFDNGGFDEIKEKNKKRGLVISLFCKTYRLKNISNCERKKQYKDPNGVFYYAITEDSWLKSKFNKKTWD